MSLSRIGTRDLVTLPPDASAQEAARWMEDEDVGSIVVVDAGRPLGIVTDRDLVLRVLRRGLDPASVRLTDVMSLDLVTAADDFDVEEAAWRMREHKIRRLPVLDAQGRLVGIVTLDDLIGYLGSTRGDVAEIIASFHAPYQAV